MNPTQRAKLAALLAATYAMEPASTAQETRRRQPRKFTDARKIAAQAKRDRKNAKRLANHQRQRGSRS